MNADKANASQAQHDALDLQARVAEVAQQADTFSKSSSKNIGDRHGTAMICSVRWSTTVSSVFIGVHRRQNIPCFLRTNTLPRTRQVHRFDHLNRRQVDRGAMRRACFGCGQWAALCDTYCVHPLASALKFVPYDAAGRIVTEV
jgi:hypothetical protein